MEFCPDCGAMLMPVKGKVKCRCGYEKSLSLQDIEDQYHMEGETNPEAKVIVTDRDNVALPTTKITCYKCGGTKATGGQYRQDPLMRLRPISSDVQNAVIHGGVQTEH